LRKETPRGEARDLRDRPRRAAGREVVNKDFRRVSLPAQNQRSDYAKKSAALQEDPVRSVGAVANCGSSPLAPVRLVENAGTARESAAANSQAQRPSPDEDGAKRECTTVCARLGELQANDLWAPSSVSGARRSMAHAGKIFAMISIHAVASYPITKSIFP
jgi:hypothetical protein